MQNEARHHYVRDRLLPYEELRVHTPCLTLKEGDIKVIEQLAKLEGQTPSRIFESVLLFM